MIKFIFKKLKVRIENKTIFDWSLEKEQTKLFFAVRFNFFIE